MLATSDLPGGVVNVLTGCAAELAPHFASHMDVNAVVNGCDDAEIVKTLEGGMAINLERFADHRLDAKAWAAGSENPYWILDTVEMKRPGTRWDFRFAPDCVKKKGARCCWCSIVSGADLRRMRGTTGTRGRIRSGTSWRRSRIGIAESAGPQFGYGAGSGRL